MNLSQVVAWGECLTICPPREVRKVELDLIPALIEPHGHGANEGLHPGGGLHAHNASATEVTIASESMAPLLNIYFNSAAAVGFMQGILEAQAARLLS